MIVIRDPVAVVSLIPELEPYPDIRALVQKRFTQLCEGSVDPYDADMLGYMIVVQPGDTVAALEAECKCAIMHNYFDPEIRYGNPDFVHSAEAIEDHCCCYELTYILGGDFGIGIFIPKALEGINPELLAMCAEFATPAMELTDH